VKWLVFGDVHGNLPALELLLEKERGAYDGIICHGDVVNYGPWSNECVQLLGSMNNVICLKGNHEEAFIQGVYNGDHPVAKAFFDIAYPFFTEKARIEKYETSYVVGDYRVQHTIGEKRIFLDTPIEDNELDANLIIGHSHQQFERKIGEFELINTGSVGQNRAYINVAEYLFYDDAKGAKLLKKFIYDVDLVIDEMERKGYSELCLNYYRSKKRV
jgi:predicted phosphodiesterase